MLDDEIFNLILFYNRHSIRNEALLPFFFFFQIIIFYFFLFFVVLLSSYYYVILFIIIISSSSNNNNNSSSSLFFFLYNNNMHSSPFPFYFITGRKWERKWGEMGGGRCFLLLSSIVAAV